MPEVPGLVLVTPSHQYPLGGCLPVSRRLALLDWARRTGAVVVEDDDNELRCGTVPLPALAALDRGERVMHLPAGTAVSALLAHCAARGLVLADLRDDEAAPDCAGEPAVVLGYGGASLGEFERAVAALAEATGGTRVRWLGSG